MKTVLQIVNEAKKNGELLTTEQAIEVAERYASQFKTEWVSDEEIEKESHLRYGEVIGGSYHADRPYNRKCFRQGAKWMREKFKTQSKWI